MGEHRSCRAKVGGTGGGVVSVVLVLLAVLVGCSEKPLERVGGPARVVVSIPALVGLVRDALPEGAEVTVLIPAGVSPHAFAPKASDLAALRRADLVIFNGMGVEVGLAAMLRSTDHAFREEIVFADVVGVEGQEDADEHAGHDHGAVDPHLWLDVTYAANFVMHVGRWQLGGDGKPREVPDGGDMRSARTVAILMQIIDINDQYIERLAPFKGARVVTDHQAWDRLFERYAIEVAGVIRPIEHVEPSAGVLARVIETIRDTRVSGIFVEPQFARGPAERIAGATGVPIGRLDPLGQGDWFAMMEANLEEIVRTLETGGSGGP